MKIGEKGVKKDKLQGADRISCRIDSCSKCVKEFGDAAASIQLVCHCIGIDYVNLLVLDAIICGTKV